MMCRAIRSFTFSRDGVTGERVAAGERVNVPGHLVPGLVAEGFIGEASDVKQENKAIPRAEEVQADVAASDANGAPSRDDIAKMGKPEIIEWLDAIEVDFDRRTGAPKLRDMLTRALFVDA